MKVSKSPIFVGDCTISISMKKQLIFILLLFVVSGSSTLGFYPNLDPNEYCVVKNSNSLGLCSAKTGTLLQIWQKADVLVTALCDLRLPVIAVTSKRNASGSVITCFYRGNPRKPYERKRPTQHLEQPRAH